MLLLPNSIIASGPVIIENGKVLLNKEKRPSGESLFMFPGGEMDNFNISLEENCRRETKEELGIDIKIIRPLQTLLVKRPETPDKLAILVHFLAKRIGEINPGEETLDWGWFDINNLPADCAPNVYEIIRTVKNML